jgi:hypothetical protein
MRAKLIARVFDQHRESGLVREWSFARFGRIDRRIREPPRARRCRRTDAHNATVSSNETPESSTTVGEPSAEGHP